MNIVQQQQTSEYYNMPLLPRLYSLLSLMVEVKKKKMALIFRPPCTTYSLFSRTKNLICFSRFNAPLLCTCAANVGEIYTMRQKKEPIFLQASLFILDRN